MLKRLNYNDSNFHSQFNELLAERSDNVASVAPVVENIIKDVRERGDHAVLDTTSHFDKVDYTAETMRVSEDELAQAEHDCPQEVTAALKLAAKRLQDFHEKQTPADIDYVDEAGVRLGMRWTAISDVGIYVPGGLASYPSSVLHNAIPAKVAGCKRVVMVVPTPNGELNPSVLVAAKLAGISEIYKIGGAQAIAALAYGTESINPVYKIVGPGNAYVAEAKRQVFGKVGIDMIAGPSEILVIADNQNYPKWIAADLLSQAEHDAKAQAILITDDADFADAVDAEIKATLATLPRKDIAAKAIADFSFCVVVSDLSQAAELTNIIAPEHLELAIENPDIFAKSIHNAGAIFLGRYTPEAIGDYVAGPSHVLPTSQTARFSSGLSVYDFIKKTSIIGCTKQSFQAIGQVTVTLAKNEGLEAHGLSASLRLE